MFFIETYISCWPIFILCNTALQVERQVITADQDPLPELLFKLPHVWLNAREVQFLWKQVLLSESLTYSKICKKNMNNEEKGAEVTDIQNAQDYYLHHLCVRVQSKQFQASFTPHFGLNISGSLLKNAINVISIK